MGTSKITHQRSGTSPLSLRSIAAHRHQAYNTWGEVTYKCLPVVILSMKSDVLPSFAVLMSDATAFTFLPISAGGNGNRARFDLRVS